MATKARPHDQRRNTRLLANTGDTFFTNGSATTGPGRLLKDSQVQPLDHYATLGTRQPQHWTPLLASAHPGKNNRSLASLQYTHHRPYDSIIPCTALPHGVHFVQHTGVFHSESARADAHDTVDKVLVLIAAEALSVATVSAHVASALHVAAPPHVKAEAQNGQGTARTFLLTFSAAEEADEYWRMNVHKIPQDQAMVGVQCLKYGGDVRSITYTSKKGDRNRTTSHDANTHLVKIWKDNEPVSDAAVAEVAFAALSYDSITLWGWENPIPSACETMSLYYRDFDETFQVTFHHEAAPDFWGTEQLRTTKDADGALYELQFSSWRNRPFSTDPYTLHALAIYNVSGHSDDAILRWIQTVQAAADSAHPKVEFVADKRGPYSIATPNLLGSDGKLLPLTKGNHPEEGKRTLDQRYTLVLHLSSFASVAACLAHLDPHLIGKARFLDQRDLEVRGFPQSIFRNHLVDKAFYDRLKACVQDGKQWNETAALTQTSDATASNEQVVKEIQQLRREVNSGNKAVCNELQTAVCGVTTTISTGLAKQAALITEGFTNSAQQLELIGGQVLTTTQTLLHNQGLIYKRLGNLAESFQANIRQYTLTDDSPPGKRQATEQQLVTHGQSSRLQGLPLPPSRTTGQKPGAGPCAQHGVNEGANMDCQDNAQPSLSPPRSTQRE